MTDCPKCGSWNPCQKYNCSHPGKHILARKKSNGTARGFVVCFYASALGIAFLIAFAVLT
ncbi:hypothetical protein GCM10007385_35160 [Tateyamaria omphalii]|nr:hypothetical protein GCM10007385_35160 [Tateyamaria omphalii]